MALKGSTNETGTGSRPTIHLILQGKGGIGKTVVATWLAEFLIGRGQPYAALTAIRSTGHSASTKPCPSRILIWSIETVSCSVATMTGWSNVF
jgi:hypothetical protein